MLVIQQNCGKEYECTVAVLKTTFTLGVLMICIQEPFIENQTISYIRFNLY